MVAIPLPVSSSKDDPARAGRGRMVNVLMEQMGDGAVNYKRMPGIAPFAASGSGSKHCRGLISANQDALLVVFDNFVESIDANGVSTSVGALDGSALVSMAINNKQPQGDIACITEVGAFLLSPTAAPIPYPDPTIGDPNSVCFLDGFFFFTYGNGECQASAINDTALNPLDAIQVNSSSDGLLKGVAFAQTLFLFTPSTIEAWTDTANASAFPFSRAAVIPRGLYSATAVAGMERDFMSTLIFVGNDNNVYTMQAYSPVKISTADIARRIGKVVDRTSMQACVYMSEGHAIWQLTSTDFTLCYDATNSVWLERDSYGQLFSRISCGCSAFSGWMVGDAATGNVGRISADVYDEYGAALVWELDSLPVDEFPAKEIVPRVDFNFVVATGTPTGIGDIAPDPAPLGTNPKVMISWSDNGGASFKQPLQRELGTIGHDGQVVSILRSGQTTRYGRVWRLRVSDPVYVGLLSGTMG